MALCDVLNTSAEKVGEVELDDHFFGVEVRPSLLHDIVCMQRANRRSGTASTKTRGEVRGGGEKPWRQKGTGRARAGSRNSPLWRGGGTTFGPKPRDYSYRLPRKVRKLGLSMALSSRLQEGNLVVLDEFSLAAPKTKTFVEVLAKFNFDNCLVIAATDDRNLCLAARNAVGFQVMNVDGLNVYDILKYKKIILIQSSLESLTGRLSR